MEKIKIAKAEYNLVIDCAKRIIAKKEQFNVKSQKYFPKRNEIDTHIFGMLGELGIAKYLDIKYEPEVFIGGDGGIDLVKGDYNIQVKTRNKIGYDFALKSDTMAEFTADIGILAYVDTATLKGEFDGLEVILGGWTTQRHMKRHMYKVNFGYGDRLSIKQEKLLPMKNIWEVL